MASAAVSHPPAEGYRRLYHFATAEHAISNIAFGRIKVARFSEMNDPFELLAFRRGTINQRQFSEYRTLVEQTCGALCFSANWADPVLWTHYSQKHRGICLGFDVKEGLAEEVSYAAERLSLKLGAEEKLDEETKRLLIYTKFQSWGYEQEWRAIVELSAMRKEGSLYFYPFNNDLNLVEVVLGQICGLNVVATRALVNKHYDAVHTFQSRIASQWFDIVPNEPTCDPDR